MDEFVCNKLHEWGLSDWIEQFRAQGIDEESLYCLDEQEIDELIPKIGTRAKFKKRLSCLKEEQNPTNQEIVNPTASCEQEPEEGPDYDQVGPSTSDTSDKGKRKLDIQEKSMKCQSPKKQRRDTQASYTEKIILADVKNIMKAVYTKLPNQGNDRLSGFLKTKISNLETDKRELVGVFGKTGAGKSSLINAIIGEKNLLPSGSVSACTSVMIKVEANMKNGKYEADIEFITTEEWKDELWSMLNFAGSDAAEEKDDDDEYHNTVEKLSALYGEEDEWKNKTPENLTDAKYFREIQEFLSSRKKTLSCESAKELSAKLVKYTRSESNNKQGKEVKRWYWPLVKCVTVRVPHNELLQHVTLVDLPGNGDRNKSRDEMWKGVVGNCTVVWIVTDINRAAAEKEPWEILKSATSYIGNGGQCQQIHFICTKSDHIDDVDDHSPAHVRACIFKTKAQAKEEVRKEFNKLNKVKKHFHDDCFQVFTVSSKEFLKTKYLQPDETEIPQLQEYLQNLNDSHSEALNYVAGAHGILSLIQGAHCKEVAENKTEVCTELDEKMKSELEKVRKAVEETLKDFEKCLSEGVEKSKSLCEKNLKTVLYPRMKGGAFHKILKCLVENLGTYKPKKGKLIQLNAKLASNLTDSIDEEFRKTFPNEGKCGPFNGVISSFSLDTERLIEKYKHVELQLIFLQTEEQTIKTNVNNVIRERKKKIYNSLMQTIEDIMHACYKKAAEFKGTNSLKNMRESIERHVYDWKDIMFERAKDTMLTQLGNLKEEILKIMEETMQKSIELSLKTDSDSIPDLEGELALVKKSYSGLRGGPD